MRSGCFLGKNRLEKGWKTPAFLHKKGLKNVTFYHLSMRIHDKLKSKQGMVKETLPVQWSRSLKIFCFVFAKTREFLQNYEKCDTRNFCTKKYLKTVFATPETVHILIFFSYFQSRTIQTSCVLAQCHCHSLMSYRSKKYSVVFASFYLFLSLFAL